MRDGRYEVGPTGISMPYAYAGVQSDRTKGPVAVRKGLTRPVSPADYGRCQERVNGVNRRAENMWIKGKEEKETNT